MLTVGVGRAIQEARSHAHLGCPLRRITDVYLVRLLRIGAKYHPLVAELPWRQQLRRDVTSRELCPITRLYRLVDEVVLEYVGFVRLPALLHDLVRLVNKRGLPRV
jgi:hypothetical protein